jgi:phosphatidylinositol 3,5-bisphosphate 5-phosphatase
MAETPANLAGAMNGQPSGGSTPSNAPSEIYPPLQNNAENDASAVSSVTAAQKRALAGEMSDADEPVVARPFVRTSTPESGVRPGDEDEEEDAGSTDDHVFANGLGESSSKRSIPRPKMHRFSLYETAGRFYIVGSDLTERRYRILKIDRTTHDESELSITDDRHVYTQKEVNALLDTIDDGNRATGGVKLRCTTWGLLGFIKFTGPYYMLLITKKSTVAMLGGHYVYQVEGTELVPLTVRGHKPDSAKNGDEARYVQILHTLDLSRSFYYSYSYNITRTLQYNISAERAALAQDTPRLSGVDEDLNTMFVWNMHLLAPAVGVLGAPTAYDWCRPIIHGYMDQAAISVYGRVAHVTIIARRSRHFAGARFLKRGANDRGYVANDVETEQVVSEALTTSFHAPGPMLYANTGWTSYVQHRGSIPLYWTQDATGVTPKPPIELNLVDPFYSAAALHFDNLFERYGAPIYVLDLVKARERTPRESKLLVEYTNAINYLNQFLPADKKIYHNAWDMSRAAKSPDGNVMGTLEEIAKEVMQQTGFFHNGDGHTTPIRMQNGVARTNCIDCLDRTNAAQFVIGKRALGVQLHALGIMSDDVVRYDTDAANLFTHMWHDHGDTIALQYGGSQLVNTTETYRRINAWTSHSRDMIESFRRYYNNSFLDGQRQESYNLFLGNYVFIKGQPTLWDLTTDYYLHHADPRTWLLEGGGGRKRDYRRWYTPRFLEERALPKYPIHLIAEIAAKTKTHAKSDTEGSNKNLTLKRADDYWLEYYRPAALSSFLKMFPSKMHSTIKFTPFKASQDGHWDLSPFRVRSNDGDRRGEKTHVKHDEKQRPAAQHAMEKHDQDSYEEDDNDLVAATVYEEKKSEVSQSPSSPRGISLQRWLQPPSTNGRRRADSGASHQRNESGTSAASAIPPSAGIPLSSSAKSKPTALEKSRAAQRTFTRVVHESLHPDVTPREEDDYARYIAHPQNLPLVVSADAPAADADVDAEYREYIHGAWQTEGIKLVPPTAVPPIPDVAAGSFGSSLLGNVPGEMARLSLDAEQRQLAIGGDDEAAVYAELLRVGENPLTVTEEDAAKKRYKAYGKWLRGKSLFKQQPVD